MEMVMNLLTRLAARLFRRPQQVSDTVILLPGPADHFRGTSKVITEPPRPGDDELHARALLLHALGITTAAEGSAS